MRWCVLVVIAGCVVEEPPEPVIVDHVTVDVVIAPSGLTLYAASSIAQCHSRFPAIGSVTQVSDVNASCDPPLFGCVEHVTYAGATYAVPANEEPMVIASPPSGPVLELEGCGRSARVALPIVTLPPPPVVSGSIIHDATNRVVHVDWESDPRATSHLVTLAGSLWSEIHHVQGGTEQFSTQFPGWLVTIVQTLLPGREQITPLGLVRVWPASEPAVYQFELARVP